MLLLTSSLTTTEPIITSMKLGVDVATIVEVLGSSQVDIKDISIFGFMLVSETTLVLGVLVM